MNQPAIKLVDDQPCDWQNRSSLTIVPGLWRMRNGHTAKVIKRIDLPYIETATKKPKVYPIWKGVCIECEEARTWNVNGTYSPVGKHGYDLLGRA